VFVYYYVPVYIGCTFALWLILRRHDPAGNEAEGRLRFVLALAILLGLFAGCYLDPLLISIGLRAELVEEARLRDLPFWFAFMALGLLTGLTGSLSLRSGAVLAGSAAVAYALYAGVRVLSIGDAAAYDSMALFAYASLLCLAALAMPVRNTFLGFIGSGSYFIYLWHIFPIMWLRDHAPWHATGATASAATWAAAAAASIAALAVIRALLPPRAGRWLGA
jgi:hypothetical protein